MKASTLVQRLVSAIAEHGDCELAAYDMRENDWMEVVGIAILNSDSETVDTVFEIVAEYK